MAVSQRRRLSSAENGAQVGKTNGNSHRAPNHSSAEAKQKRELDREFLISVLESSATRRDAKAYLQTFGSSLAKTSTKSPSKHDGIRAVTETPQFVQGLAKEPVEEVGEAPHIAIVKLREPQAWDDALLDGVTKTLTQLRDLGLLSVIILDCPMGQASPEDWNQTVFQQTDRILSAIGRHGSPGAQVVDSGIWKNSKEPQNLSSITPAPLFVGFKEAFTTPLKHGHILVVPPRAYSQSALSFKESDSNETVLALARFFSGLQFNSQILGGETLVNDSVGRPLRRALVDRVIVIDPLGGIPLSEQRHGARVFINLEEEFEHVESTLTAAAENTSSAAGGGFKPKHLENLRLVKSTLAILPSTASAVITSPAEAANLRIQSNSNDSTVMDRVAGEVGTRRWQNPLIHNLLTDRPIYSASLPIGRIKPAYSAEVAKPHMPTTTLAKKGLPVTIFPDPRATPWLPPKPGAPRLRLTDTCVDLPRLIHLIDDSFSRKLDVKHYLDRVQDSLAGIIIAGEYEGGAILTWEKPYGMDEGAAYDANRLVPYLDKFAVLKKSQGAGGVADIVFNAMVRDCFPGGVCWRSRKNNPVNKWYFERSAGVRKLPESNWAMFWTNPNIPLDEDSMKAYEDVCRSVVPSWADDKQAD
ncbi:mitochondrial amino-acid acetyltransferase [Lasiosphaeris hirsuta]|uniref:Amino-acid acetyltransferase, mitochondrial n=1 Tax=Lasiosphaeris hirsuta TaxID=260670 RepID=A0AA40DU89_9PEZI|nr:mitochondrial amino-acid acetyltransferase [Lasiosphaeris hirsuta]